MADLNVPVAQVPQLKSKISIFVDLLLGNVLFYATPMALPDQLSTPLLQVGNAGFAAACSAWAPTVFDPAVWTVGCAGGKVSVSPKP